MGDEDGLEQLESTIGHIFKDRSLLIQALSHRSTGEKNNERLEFLGDAVLSHIVAEWLYRTTEDNEFMLTRKRSHLSDRTALVAVGNRIDITSFMILGESIQEKVSKKMIADTVEALIGAVYLDGGMVAARTALGRILFIDEIMKPAFDREDWITQLKEWCDANQLQPRYLTLEERDENDPKRKFFVAWVNVGGSSGNGTGATKKEAMADAAKDVLAILDQS